MKIGEIARAAGVTTSRIRFYERQGIIPPAERAAFMAGYKAAAGFTIETLNAAAPTIPAGARAGNGLATTR